MQNEQLYERWELNLRKGRKETTQSIMVAYITFKSMLGKQIAQKIFEFAELNSKDDPSEKDKAFLDNFLTVTNTVAMSGIIWKNIGLRWYDRLTRKIIIWVLAIGIIFGALILMVIFQNYSTELLAAAP